MSMSVGASSSNALSYLQQLLQQGTAGAGDATAASASDPLSMLMQEISGGGTPPGQTTAPSSNTATGPSSPTFSPETMAALLSAQGQQQTGGPDAKLFAKLDADGDGQISKDEFSAAASKAGADSSVADAVFAKIDANGDGSVSQSELAKADKGGGHHHRHVGGGGGAPSAGGAQDPLEAMLSSATASGATTQTSTNADGSTTTTISYADGSKIDMTTPAAAQASSTSDSSSSSGSGSSGSKSNLLEQLIKLQSQVLSFATSTMSAIA
jgi:hypothetical protein